MRTVSRFAHEGARVTVAGFDAGVPSCWLMSSVDDAEFAIPAWQPVEISGLCATPCSHGSLRDEIIDVIAGRDPADLDHETDGLAILEAQRRHGFTMPGSGESVRVVGVHAQIATVFPDGEIVTRILKRWN